MLASTFPACFQEAGLREMTFSKSAIVCLSYRGFQIQFMH
jgi:hypothetical protein